MLRFFLLYGTHMHEVKGERDMLEKTEWRRLPIAMTIGLAVGLATVLLVTAIGASLITSEKLPENGVDWISTVALLFGSAVSAATAAGKMRRNGLVICLGGSLTLYVALCCMSAVLFDGLKSGVGITALVMLIGGVVVWLVCLGKQKKRKYTHTRYRS